MEGVSDIARIVVIAFIILKILCPREGADSLASRGESHRSPLIVVAIGGYTGNVVSVSREASKVAGSATHRAGQGVPSSGLDSLIGHIPCRGIAIGLPDQGGGVGSEVGGL